MLGRHVHMRSGVLASFALLGPGPDGGGRAPQRVEDIIDFLKIQDLRRRPTGSLAYGLQKRVELGRALALEPKVLLLDEPMGGMNQEEKEDMARFILDVNEEMGRPTIILIEHDMGVVMDISDRVAVLDMGQKIAEGTPDEVRANPRVIKAYLGESQGNADEVRSPWLRRHAAPAAAAQRPSRSPTGRHPREGPRHLADLDLARVPRPGARLRARPGRARLQARRQALGHRRQPPAALLGAGGGAGLGGMSGARLPGLDRQGAGLRAGTTPRCR